MSFIKYLLVIGKMGSMEGNGSSVVFSVGTGSSGNGSSSIF